MDNKRFINKSTKTDYESLLAIVNYYEQGGTIKVVKPARKTKRGYTVGKQSKVVKG